MYITNKHSCLTKGSLILLHQEVENVNYADHRKKRLQEVFSIVQGCIIEHRSHWAARNEMHRVLYINETRSKQCIKANKLRKPIIFPVEKYASTFHFLQRFNLVYINNVLIPKHVN